MSATPKIPRKMAEEVVEELRRALSLDVVCGDGEVGGGGWKVAGSIRRQREQVGDIDLVCALPSPASAGAQPEDRLCEAILERFVWRGRPGELIQGTLGADSLGWIERGVNPGFKYCCLTFVRRYSDGSVMEVPVQVQRYIPGPLGNFGYQMLLRTGPREFGMAVLSRWRGARGGGACDAADHGYLLDVSGKAVATPTEMSVFELAGMRWVAPENWDGRVWSGAAGGVGVAGGSPTCGIHTCGGACGGGGVRGGRWQSLSPPAAAR